MNQHLLSALDRAFSEKRHGFQSTKRQGGGFRISYRGRFDGQHPVFRQTGILRIRTQAKTSPCKNLVSAPKSGDRFADSFNFSGQLLSQNTDSSWSSEAHIDPQGEPEPEWESKTAQLTVSCCDGCRIDSDQDFLVLGSRFCNLLELKTVRWSVLCPDNGLHTFPPG